MECDLHLEGGLSLMLMASYSHSIFPVIGSWGLYFDVHRLIRSFYFSHDGKWDGFPYCSQPQMVDPFSHDSELRSVFWCSRLHKVVLSFSTMVNWWCFLNSHSLIWSIHFPTTGSWFWCSQLHKVILFFLRWKIGELPKVILFSLRWGFEVCLSIPTAS